MSSKPRILLIDDHTLVRAAIKRILTDSPDLECIGETGSPEEALHLIPTLHPDVVLLDLYLQINGQDLAHVLLQLYPALKILIVSICLDQLQLKRLFQAGVRGYLAKTSSSEEMLKAIRAVAQDGHYVDPEMAQSIVANSNNKKLEQCSFDLLSERELQVALLIIEGQSIPAMSEILGINRKTINSYRSRSFQKLGVTNDVELTLMAYRQGLLQNAALEASVPA